METAEWKDTVQRIRNNATSRQINKLFGTVKVGEVEVEHFLSDYDIPTFYSSVRDIPLAMPGIYFLWHDICLEYIGISAVCIHRAIKRNKAYCPDRHIISATVGWDWYECYPIKQFLVAILRPDKNPYNPPKKAGKPAVPSLRIAEHFWAKVELPDETKWDGGCRHWLSYIDNKGYGRVRLWGKKRLAHRVAYELAEGTIPIGGRIIRTCGDKLCCNPLHLELRLPKGK